VQPENRPAAQQAERRKPPQRINKHLTHFINTKSAGTPALFIYMNRLFRR